ncbi:MAG: zinc ABC transporter substrate-binding protein, partial [Akkermansiaceae bacterium]|nr:zinc ABC transporter substrate-binding protein [Akkermansiaceae bacterium]
EKLPTLKAEILCDHGEHAHVHETDDPHWWHSVDCWRRAARQVRDELVRIDPDHAAGYRANARQVRAELLDLRAWPPRTRPSPISATSTGGGCWQCRD